MSARAPALFFALSLAACGGAITEPDVPTVAPTGVDQDAGTWRMILLARVDDVAVAPPSDVTSAEYRAELAAIAAQQRQLTDDQRAAVRAWSGGVLRWNEVLRELVARYNLPPAPRPDGTYPIPDAANPFADPQFPFANPPYAARAYSYVAVAQFEALKAAW